MQKKVLIYVVPAVLAAIIAVVVFIAADDDAENPVVAGNDDAVPAIWPVQGDARSGKVDLQTSSVQVGALSVSAPQPSGAPVDWALEQSPKGLSLSGEGKVLAEDATFEWRFAAGNPHSVFEGEFTVPTSMLTEPVIGALTLPEGEVSYVNSRMEVVGFAGKPVVLSALTPGAIRWRNGADTLVLWQWRADRVEITEQEGGVVVAFHWYNPGHHRFPEDCAEQLADWKQTVKPRLTVSFADVPLAALGRFPSGVTSAVVPMFYDPLDAEDPAISDGASAGPGDFAARATTIAMGHSASNDARYGNGGLVGLEVGGTVIVPNAYSADVESLNPFRETLAPTSVEVVDHKTLRPNACEHWLESLETENQPLLAEPVEFDGRFPNLVGPEQRTFAPGVGDHSTVWTPTRLTGRRKDVVTQALSRTYLERLAERRGLALLEIPLVATRNPLIPAAAETLLEPESAGHWTIHEEVARALGEVELLSEEAQFDFLSLGELTGHWRGTQRVEIDEQTDGVWAVRNRSGEALPGFTVVVDGLASALVDDERVEQATRQIGGGGEQTWIWWDLPADGVSRLRIERSDAPTALPVRWTAKP